MEVYTTPRTYQYQVQGGMTSIYRYCRCGRSLHQVRVPVPGTGQQHSTYSFHCQCVFTRTNTQDSGYILLMSGSVRMYEPTSRRADVAAILLLSNLTVDMHVVHTQAAVLVVLERKLELRVRVSILGVTSNGWLHCASAKYYCSMILV